MNQFIPKIFLLGLLSICLFFCQYVLAQVEGNIPFSMTVNKSHGKSDQNLLLTLEMTAGMGNPTAIYNLAHNYHHGTYSAVDLVKAKSWYDKAAVTNSPTVRYKIGRMYEVGAIFDKNLATAVEHYTFAADAGDINAQANLGAIYLSDKSTLQQGINWSEKAAEQNSVQAQVNLAMAYQKGY